MALKSQSLFLYGYTITASNQYIDFKISGGGSQLTATIANGYYSLTDLMTAISNAMFAADPTNTYTVTATRTQSSGTQNRVTIATSGAFLSLLFSSGTHNLASIASTIGFAATDRTGATTYTGTLTTGTAFTSTLVGYNYGKPNRNQKIFGAVNIATSGAKEAVVWANYQQFVTVTFKYEPETYIDSAWVPFFLWAMKQQAFEFTPEITAPTVFYNVTLENTPKESMGLGFMLPEMVSEIPFLFSVGPLTFRVKV